MSLEDKLQPKAQRKLLALDGGGIRGMMTVEVLAKIESLLRTQQKNPNLVLADYFDYIAGTSTGAIIAACLSLGKSVAELREFYVESGPAMFDKARLWEQFRYKFRDDKLAAKFQEVMGKETTLGSKKLRTLLLMVLRNASTDSPWPVSNNPSAKYNRSGCDGCNLDLPLWQLVRASTAAPTYFPPETVQIGSHEFVFVDGGITMYNNPAFQLFLMATVEPYHLCWPAGLDKMLLVSIGTGTSPGGSPDLDASQMNLLYNVGAIPGALMTAALHEQDFLCRVFGDCVAGDEIDSEIGDMIGKRGPSPQKLFTYARYNAELSSEALAKLGLADINPQNVKRLDSVEFIGDLQRIGRRVGELRVKPEHFARFA